MSTPCSIEMYEEPLETSLGDLDGAVLDVFFAHMIVNPFGPTMNFVAAAGKPQLGQALPLVKVMLNPFLQDVQQIGRFWVGDTWTPLRDFDPLLELDYGSCPTLMLISNQIEESVRKELAAKIFASFGEDVARVCRSVEKHFGDPWTRVSESMSGGDDDFKGISPEEAGMRMSEAVFNEVHAKPELSAFFYAWNGSIEQTSVGDHMKQIAMSSAAFKDFFFERIASTVWLPKYSDAPEKEPEVKRPVKLKLESLEQLDELMASEQWRNFEDDRLVDLLRMLFFGYGYEGATSHVPNIAKVYQHAIAKGMDTDTRGMLEAEMVELVDSGKLLPVVFLPFLVLDNSVPITTKAAIDFVSSSDYVNGELYAFGELRNLFIRSTLANRAAVFGALVAMGDQEVLKFLEELRPTMGTEEVRQAARVHTQFPQHHAIQFWLQWAKQLVNSSNDDDQRTFGSCASALILVLEHDIVGRVSAGKRNFPCQKSPSAITIEQEWSLDEYAEMLAPELYAIEASEAAPRLFSDVLRKWGLKPRAPVMDQFLPEPGRESETFRSLRDPEANLDHKNRKKSFIEKIFGKL
jgi:hypothetical protein